MMKTRPGASLAEAALKGGSARDFLRTVQMPKMYVKLWAAGGTQAVTVPAYLHYQNYVAQASNVLLVVLGGGEDVDLPVPYEDVKSKIEVDINSDFINPGSDPFSGSVVVEDDDENEFWVDWEFVCPKDIGEFVIARRQHRWDDFREKQQELMRKYQPLGLLTDEDGHKVDLEGNPL